MGGSQIDDEFKLGWLFHRKVSGLRSLENFVDNVAGAPEQVRKFAPYDIRPAGLT